MTPQSYLVTGVSGSGKTSVMRALSDRGYDAIDMDYNIENNNLTAAENQQIDEHAVSSVNDMADGNWVWHRDTFENFKESATGDRIFFGANAANMFQFWPEFDTIFLLEIDEPTMDYRIEHRGADTEPGVGPEVQDYQRRNLTFVQNEIKEHGKVVSIDALQSLETIVQQILDATEVK